MGIFVSNCNVRLSLTPLSLSPQFVQAESLPISCEFDSVEAGKQDDIDGDIHYLLCRARAHSDSSEMETDSDNEMTVIQSKRNRQASDRSHGEIGCGLRQVWVCVCVCACMRLCV